MRVLVACERSGVVRDAFRRRGHDAVSVDWAGTWAPGPHIRGHVDEAFADGQRWDLMIAHPPCTYLCVASAVALAREGESRMRKLKRAARFFRSMLERDVPLIAVENPRMLRRAKAIVGRDEDCIVHPWQFGSAFAKETAFWLKGLPPLVPTITERPSCVRPMGYRGGTLRRGMLRAVTDPYLADAIAEQWGGAMR